jgi:tRNA G18 (ribose-2'-O)-methylase SpoU
MSRLTYRQRHRRIQQSLEEAWAAANMPAEDPGLRERYEEFPRAPIRLIASPLRVDANQGGLLRLAEAFRLERVDLSPEPDRARDFSGSMGAKIWQPFRWIETDAAIREARDEGMRVYGLTVAENAVPIRQAAWQFPCAIVLGEEKHGLDAELLTLCDDVIAIPMWGLMSSLNIGMAAAVAVHYAAEAFYAANPEFEPVRNASRKLLGLEPIDYRE